MRTTTYGLRIAAAALVATALAGCGSTEPDPGAAPGNPAPTQVFTPTLPPVADDAANVKKAVVTAADLGKPWVQPKKVNQVQKSEGQLCPGQKNAGSLAKARAQDIRRMTEGTEPTAAIGSFGVRAYAFGEEQKWHDAVTAAQAGCASWTSAEKLYVTLEVVTPPAVPGADAVLAHIERIYADKTKKTLHYVRHYYEARTGRFVSSFELAYVQPKSDPTGKDLTKSAALLAKQVAKTRATFDV